MTAVLRPATTVRHVFDDSTDAMGSRYCSVALEPDGRLVIETHDRGPVVQQFFGVREYDAFERFSLQQTDALRRLLGDDLVGAIASQFRHSAVAFHEFVDAVGVERGELWSRVGN